MSNQKVKVLLIIEECNPDWISVPLVAYNFFHEINKLADVTLVTHFRNKEAFDKRNYENIIYINESNFVAKYHSVIASLTAKNKINWPLYHVLGYPVYAEFNHRVYQQFKTKILKGDYDIVHALTPMIPRYPVKVVKVCKNTPFLLGPVNGGVPFPAGFREIAKKEYANFNFLRSFGRSLLPGYVETYKKADRILAGSTFTLDMLKKMFAIQDDRISLFYENGIPSNFIKQAETSKPSDRITLLFVGRLVPYKGADILIEAISKLNESTLEKIKLIVVGDGQEKSSLEMVAQKHQLEKIVSFTGWVSQKDTLEYYNKANIFCFPSIREFGGAVVLEAMACGLPCIVVNNGGIGEYVTEETGFKIEPISREYLIQELKEKIEILVDNEELRQKMSAKSIERVQEFEWERKATKIVEIYKKMITQKSATSL